MALLIHYFYLSFIFPTKIYWLRTTIKVAKEIIADKGDCEDVVGKDGDAELWDVVDWIVEETGGIAKFDGVAKTDWALVWEDIDIDPWRTLDDEVAPVACEEIGGAEGDCKDVVENDVDEELWDVGIDWIVEKTGGTAYGEDGIA